jgi:hypothetical protein
MASSDRNPSMPLRKIDLSDSKYHSDGTPGFHEKMTREDNASFLKNLTEAFNKKSSLVTDLGKLSFPSLVFYLPCPFTPEYKTDISI